MASFYPLSFNLLFFLISQHCWIADVIIDLLVISFFSVKQLFMGLKCTRIYHCKLLLYHMQNHVYISKSFLHSLMLYHYHVLFNIFFEIYIWQYNRISYVDADNKLFCRQKIFYSRSKLLAPTSDVFVLHRTKTFYSFLYTHTNLNSPVHICNTWLFMYYNTCTLRLGHKNNDILKVLLLHLVVNS